MGFLKIHCGYCKQTFEVYQRGLEAKDANVCPHCDHRIPEKYWQRIQDAATVLHNANFELFKAHVDDHITCFRVDYMTDHIF